jgi:mannose-6-phosphate isomerase-like protein (cupin superfamily)
MDKNIKLGKITNGLLHDCSRTMYPCKIWGVYNSTMQFDGVASNYFGYVSKGSAEISLDEGGYQAPLSVGMYFSSVGPLKIKSEGEVVVVEKIGFRGLFQIGGPVEASGRLTYIDNCRTTLLVSPVRFGDPCLNLLTFPPRVLQSNHIHPTIRVGVVLAGGGICHSQGMQLPLEPGNWFFLNEGVPHHFESKDSGLSLVAFHPETDWGPTNQIHPMLNRTFLVAET